ncbi:MAG: hypothetical protein WD467_02285 [Candidatus Saccharimonadales bacterium]
MAGITTHIVLSQKALSSFLPDKNKEEFIVGTSFPDIRYLNVVSREQTHLQKVNLESIEHEPDSFTAGFRYHSLIDEARESFILKNNIYTILPESPFITQALKIYEDKVLLDKLSNRAGIIRYFDNILPAEEEFAIPVVKLTKWHKLIQEWLSSPAEEPDVRLVLAALSFDKEQTKEITELIHKIEDIPIIKDITMRLYEDLETILTVEA